MATTLTGKRVAADVARGLPTYPALVGLEAARERVRQLHSVAAAELATMAGTMAAGGPRRVAAGPPSLRSGHP